MLRPARVSSRSVCALFVCMLVGSGLAAPRSASAASIVTVEPSALDVTLPLGQVSQATVTLSNIGDATTLTAYEARPEPAPAVRRGARPAATAEIPAQAERLDRVLVDEFRKQPEQPRDFIVYLRSQADVSGAYGIRDWAERGRFVYRTLTEHAIRTQADLVRELRTQGVGFQSLWVVNALLVHGSLAEATALVGRADVALVRANRTQALPSQIQSGANDPCSPDDPSNMVCWNIRAIGADRVWRDFGVDGKGVVVANIDTGVAITHTALIGSYRGNLGNNTFDHNYNWYSPEGASEQPEDAHGHGTHTMGTMVGAAVGGPAVGIAPGARWLAAQGCDGMFCSDADLIRSAEWMLAPTRIDGSQPRPDLRPMIVNNSWGADPGSDWFAPYATAWRAAGIFPVFAAGNAGSTAVQSCGSVDSPGDYSDVVAVGAVNQQGSITSFSLLGPGANGRVKPDFVAPGKDIYSTTPPSLGNYKVLDGTSMATPHVAGTVALIWSANPALIGDYDATYALLRDTAVRTADDRCGGNADGANNVYGYGRIDAYAAVARARVDIPWLHIDQPTLPLVGNGTTQLSVHLDARAVPAPGTYRARIQLFGSDLTRPLQTLPVTLHVEPTANQVVVTGHIQSAETGAPLRGLVNVSGDQANGVPISTAADGSFQLTLAEGARYELVANALAYMPLRQSITATAGLKLDLKLTPDQPRLSLASTPLTVTIPFASPYSVNVPIGNSGTRPLIYELSVPRDQFVVGRSDEANGPTYNWIELPRDASVITSTANGVIGHVPLGMTFPFYSYAITDVVVLDDGMITFDRDLIYRGVTTSCLPDESIFYYLIAPLRLDIDLTKGGRVRYATLGSDRFVLNYENVRLHDDPTIGTYTFQLVLYNDGRILFQYKQLAPLPYQASAGVQRAPNELIQLGCGPTAPLSNNLAVEFRPQPNSMTWMKTSIISGTLQPGEHAEIPVALSWVRPSPMLPFYEGHLLFASNDPLHRRMLFPIRVYPEAARFEQWLLFSMR